MAAKSPTQRTMQRDDWRTAARRPAITPVFACAAAFWASCAAAYVLSAGIGARQCLAGALVASACALAALLCRHARIPAMACFALAFALFGAALALGQAATMHQAASALAGAEMQGARATFLEDAAPGAYGASALVRVEVPQAGRIVALARISDEVEPHYGQVALLDLKVQDAREEPDEYAWQRGAAVAVNVSSCVLLDPQGPFAPLVDARLHAIEALAGEGTGHAIAQALACGYRGALRGSDAEASFQACGLAHVVAVSGAHLVIVTGFASAALQAMRVPRKAAIGLIVALMAAYSVVAGAPPSALRACVMSSVGILSLMGKRRPSSLNALGIGILALVGSSPAMAVSASFALSVLATVGIVLFMPLVQGTFERIAHGRAPAVVNSLALTASASLISQLYSASIFGMVPLVAPLANVACTPLLPFCCALGLAGAVAGAAGAPFAAALAHAAAVSCEVLAGVAQALAALPYASVPFHMETPVALAASAAIACILWLAWDALQRPVVALTATAAIVVALLAFSQPFAGDAIVMLDVGQGDAFLVQSRGATLLVDTGNQDSRLLEQLARAHIAHLDAVLVTHADDDHCGSLDALRKAVDVGQVMLLEGICESEDASCAGLAREAGLTGTVVEVSRGDSFAVGRFDFTVVWPSALEHDGGNADSVVLYCSYDGDDDDVSDINALFTGDAEHEELQGIIDSGAVGHVDILKVGHHGSRNAMTSEQARQLSPSIALIGVGKQNRYGHPTREILDMLDSLGCTVLRSDLDGGVRIELTAASARARKL